MRSLLEFQRSFGNAVLGSIGGAEIPPGFGIYKGNVYGNWTKALTSAYPIVRKIVGESFFESVARAFARAHPSKSGDLNEFGERFPAFVAAFPDAMDLPYLPDVARMEWLAHRAYFAADAPRFDPARLAGVAPEEYQAIPLACAQASALMVSSWPLARLWEMHQDGYSGDLAINLEPGFERILIYRRHWRAEVEAISPGDYRLLAEASRGATLGDALQRTVDAVPDFDAAAALSQWVEKGVVTL